MGRYVHNWCSLVTVLALAACSAINGPVPAALRGSDYPLVRVDGTPARGVSSIPVPSGSRDAKNDCQAKVAEGLLHISDDGLQFNYRSTMRNCAGQLLVTEINEGSVSGKDSSLTFIIDSPTGPLTFVGRWSDSTIVIYNLGGFLEFARPARQR
jgi:hypothetical protein